MNEPSSRFAYLVLEHFSQWRMFDELRQAAPMCSTPHQKRLYGLEKRKARTGRAIHAEIGGICTGKFNLSEIVIFCKMFLATGELGLSQWFAPVGCYNRKERTMYDCNLSLQDSVLRINAKLQCEKASAGARPYDFRKPPYGTPEYWYASSVGWITEEETEADCLAHRVRSLRAIGSMGRPGPKPERHSRPEPRASRQYLPSMATTALRDDRLTPQAKALLGVIRARCGKGASTDTTKATLASIMSRSLRSIQRYLSELVQFGYITTKTRTRPNGMYAGLRVWISETVLPFFAQTDELAAWIMQTDVVQEETRLSPINDVQKILFPRASFSYTRASGN